MLRKYIFFLALIVCFLPFRYSEAALTTNLVGHWQLNEASGTRADSAGSNTLSAVGTVGSTTGKIGNAATSDGTQSTNYLNITDNAALSTGNIDFTISAWVNMNSKAGAANKGIVAKWGASGTREYALVFNPTNDRFTFYVSSNGTTFGSVDANTLGSPSLSTWYFITAWHDAASDTLNIQVNNGTVDSIAYSAGVFDSGSPFQILTYLNGLSGTSTVLNGAVDSVSMWKRVLTSQERTVMYNSGSGYDYPFPSTAPFAPSDLNTSPATSKVALAWTAPYDGDSAITDYVIEYKLTSSGSWSTFSDGTSTTTNTIVTGLTDGLSYDFRVSGVNSVGTGPVSSTATATSGAFTLGTSAVGFWGLNETSGSRADSIGSNTLTQVGTVGSTTGKVSNAVSSDGIYTNYLTINDNAALSMGNIDFSVSAWVYMTAKTNANQGIMGKYDTAGNKREYDLSYNTAQDRFNFYASSNGTSSTRVSADALGSPSTGTWYFITAWHDSVNDTLNIQVNNGTVNSTAYSVGVLDSTTPFQIAAFENGGSSGSSYVFQGRIDAAGVWKKVLSSSERTLLYNAGSGMEAPFGDSITISSPKAYQVLQRNGSNQANISISGTYTGSPTSIEASWNGGAYSTITASPTGGSFSGTLSNQTAGQGTLTVRFTNSTSVSYSQSYVGIGDIFVIAGQSNSVGWNGTLQSYSHATLKAGLFGNDDQWKELIDPTDDSTGQIDAVSDDGANPGGSIWPNLTTRIMADQSVPVAFIPTAKGGSTIRQWQKQLGSSVNNTDTTAYSSCPGTLDTSGLYGSMSRRINAVGGSVKAILFVQGENDATNNTSISGYKSYALCFTNNAYTDFGVSTIMAQIGRRTSVTDETRINNVRTAQRELWDDGSNNHILFGPTLYDETVAADGVHFQTTTVLQSIANRFWLAMKKHFYGGTDDGRGPRLVSATHNAAKTVFTLTFTDNALPILPATGIQGFAVRDNGTPLTISSAVRSGTDKIILTTTTGAAGTIAISMAYGNSDGYGVTVPTDSSTYNLPVEFFVGQASTLLDIPGAPTSIIATPGNTQVGLTWTAPSSNGAAITDYVVEYKLSADSVWTTFTDGVSATAAATVTGLTNGSAYDFRISAVNSAGTSPVSSTSSSTPRTVPGSPTSVLTTPGNTQMGLSWTAPASNGGSAITDYLVEYKLAADSLWTTFTDGVSTTPSTTVTGLTNGASYNFRISAINVAGTGSPSSTATATPVTTPGAPTSLNATPGDSQVGLTWVAPVSNGGSALTDYFVEYKLTSSGSWSTFTDGVSTTAATTVTGLTNASSYDFRVSAINAVGTGTASSTATATPADSTGPILSSISSGTPTHNAATITWTTNEAASSIVDYGLTSSYGTSTSEADTSPRVTSHSVGLSSLTPSTVYHYRVRSKDAALNTGTSTDQTFTTSAAPDVTAPIISSISSGTPTDTNVTITWTTDENASTQVDYGTTASYGTTTTETDTSPRVTSHGVSFGSLTPSTTYHYRVRSKDASNNTAVSGDQTFTTSATPDTTPPNISSIVATPTYNSMQITWTTDEGASSIVDYGTTTSYGTSTTETDTSPRVTSHTVNISSLSPSTTYHFRVKSNDAASNLATSGDQTFTTSAAPDVTAPIISSISANPGDTTVTITWTTNENASSILEYGATTSYGTTTSETDTSPRVTSHSVSLSGLSSATTYHYRVKSNDSSSNLGTSTDQTFTTTTPIVTPPTPTPSGGSVPVFFLQTISQQQNVMTPITEPIPETKPTAPQVILKGYWKRGAKNPEIKNIQAYLNKALGLKLANDGIFGKGTEAALAKFQKQKGITPAAGVFGQITREYMNKHPF